MQRKISPTEVSRVRTLTGLSQTEFAERLGVTRNYVSMLERGDKEVRENSPIGLLFGIVRQQVEQPAPPVASVAPSRFEEPSVLREDEPPYHVTPRSRLIRVMGWAHAGEAASYEQLPDSWQDEVPTECRDPKAFAVRLEGESMEPKFSEGDLLILQPSKEAYTNCLAVCRFQNDGVVFRRVEFLPDGVRLVALNPAYAPNIYPREAFSWIYPVWGRWTQIWK